MESITDNSPLIVIVGATASGKSALALTIAERYNGEIVCADSRTVYKGMDIGTAKPSLLEQASVPHHLLDIVEPDQRFTVADFKIKAQQQVNEIVSRGKLPIVTGGTGLYVDSVLYNFSFRPQSDEQRRKELEQLSVEQLQAILSEQNVPLPTNDRNPRHLIRAIETGGEPPRRESLRDNTCIVGIEIEPELLLERVVERIDKMFAAGLEQEVRTLFEQFGRDCMPLQTIGYQEFLPYFNGAETIQEVRQTITQHTMQYAKRQKTWFKRNKSIHWISKTEQAVDVIATFLNK